MRVKTSLNVVMSSLSLQLMEVLLRYSNTIQTIAGPYISCGCRSDISAAEYIILSEKLSSYS